MVKMIMAITAELGVLIAGYTAYNTVKKVGTALKQLNTALLFKETAATVTQTGAIGAATVAQNGFNTAMRLSPFGMVLTAITGVTAAISFFSSVISDSKDDVEEYTQAAIEMNNAMEAAQSEFRDSETEMLATAATADIYIDRLEEIEAATGGNVAANEEYHNILSLISRTIPELSDYIDLETNSIRGGTLALREYTDEWKKNAETQARQNYINSLYDKYGDVIAEAQENSIKLTQTQIKRNNLEEEAAKTQERMNDLWAEAEKKSNEVYGSVGLASEFIADEYRELVDAMTEYNAEISLCQAEENDLTKAIENDNEKITEAKQVIENAEDAIANLIDAEQEGVDVSQDVSAGYTAVSEAINNVKDETVELLTAYNEAYQAAYNSVSGQYALWENAADKSVTSVDTINHALETQADYWGTYNSNLNTLLERSGNIEGLREIMASFSDGSKDSYNAIAGMASATDDELKDMIKNWKTVREEEEKISKALADTKTNFSEEMENITDDMAKAIERMNMEDEAAKAAKDTIEAYARAIAAGRGAVVDAADQVSLAMAAALSKTVVYNSPNIPIAKAGVMTNQISAYASGTDHAEKGWAMVGENGPELAYFGGGEQVFTAAETKAILGNSNSGSGGKEIVISPQFYINENNSSGEKTDWHKIADMIVEQVRDALKNEEIDARRKAYV